MKIVVIAGGLSPERDVSLSSGSLIANALLENGHEVMLADLYMGIELAEGAEPDMLFLSKQDGAEFSYPVPESEPDLEAVKMASGNGGRLIGKNILKVCEAADLVFIALHGAIGENGQLQAVFDTHGIRYTGSGYIGCLLAMDKDLTKKLITREGIRTPDWKVLNIKSQESVQRESVKNADITYPCVVKPVSCGSSVGVTMVENESEMKAALHAAARYEDFVMVEEKIAGREFSVGILDGRALPAIEIIPKAGFYDYTNKYQSGLTEEICPAELDEKTERAFRDTALKVHRILRLGFYSRVDFILREDGEIFCLEANTLPGMTPTSLLPQEARAAGIGYRELCDQIVRAAAGGNS